MKKKFMILMTIILCLSIFLPASVFASNTTKLTKKTYIKTGSGSNVVAKFKTTKGYAYCITPGKSGPPVGTKMHVKNTIKSGGLVYLLDKAGTSDSSFLITQLAVWKYANNFKKASSSSNWSKAKKLVSQAKKNSNYSTTPSIKLSHDLTAMNESGDYYKSVRITLVAKNIKKDLTVKLDGAPSGSKIVDSNGNKKTSFKNGDIFYVYVPANNVKNKVTFTVKASGVGYETYVERYKSNNSKHQELLVLHKESKKVKDSLNLSINPVVRKCAYYNGKYYGKDGRVVNKTTYEQECQKHYCEKIGDKYYGKDGNVVDKTTFDKECNKHVCEIIDGTYFGKDGREVDSTTYDIECNRHVCTIIGDTYFDKNGNIVDEAAYKASCEPEPAVVPVPDTADWNGLLYILIGSLMIGTTVVTLNTLSKNKR